MSHWITVIALVSGVSVSISVLMRWFQDRKRNACPPPGTAWCVGCQLNHKKTYSLPYSTIRQHLELHRSLKQNVQIKTAFNTDSQEKQGL